MHQATDAVTDTPPATEPSQVLLESQSFYIEQEALGCILSID